MTSEQSETTRERYERIMRSQKFALAQERRRREGLADDEPLPRPPLRLVVVND